MNKNETQKKWDRDGTEYDRLTVTWKNEMVDILKHGDINTAMTIS